MPQTEQKSNKPTGKPKPGKGPTGRVKTTKPEAKSSREQDCKTGSKHAKDDDSSRKAGNSRSERSKILPELGNSNNPVGQKKPIANQKISSPQRKMSPHGLDKATAGNSSGKKLATPDLRVKAAEAAMARMGHFDNNGFAQRDSAKVSKDSLAVQSVRFICPLVSSEIIPLELWTPKIVKYLSDLSKTEHELSAVLTLTTFNTNKNSLDECIETLVTYIKNILSNPQEGKYRSINTANRTFSEKVLPMKGAVEVLRAAGFRDDSKTGHDGETVNIMHLPGEADSSHLEMMVDALRTAEPLLPRVYRDPMVFKPQEADKKVYLPDEFYDLTDREVNEIYKKTAQRAEVDMPLMTKAMREKEERKHLVKYKYSVLRVRFPDTLLLQGTFSRGETQKSVKEFVDSCLQMPGKYSLYATATKTYLTEANDSKTLYELKLIPSAILNFSPEDLNKFPETYLKPDMVKNIKKI